MAVWLVCCVTAVAFGRLKNDSLAGVVLFTARQGFFCFGFVEYRRTYIDVTMMNGCVIYVHVMYRPTCVYNIFCVINTYVYIHLCMFDVYIYIHFCIRYKYNFVCVYVSTYLCLFDVCMCGKYVCTCFTCDVHSVYMRV